MGLFLGNQKVNATSKLNIEHNTDSATAVESDVANGKTFFAGGGVESRNS